MAAAELFNAGASDRPTVGEKRPPRSSVGSLALPTRRKVSAAAAASGVGKKRTRSAHDQDNGHGVDYAAETETRSTPEAMAMRCEELMRVAASVIQTFAPAPTPTERKTRTTSALDNSVNQLEGSVKNMRVQLRELTEAFARLKLVIEGHAAAVAVYTAHPPNSSNSDA